MKLLHDMWLWRELSEYLLKVGTGLGWACAYFYLWEGNVNKLKSLLYMIQEYYMGWHLAGREETQGGDDKMSKTIKKKNT